MNTHPRYRDRHGRLWEDRDGPVLLTPDPDEYPDWVSMQAIHHAYGPLELVSGSERPATDCDKALRIVADWIDTAARTAVTDVDDLIEDLRRAGYTLPELTEHPKENP